MNEEQSTRVSEKTRPVEETPKWVESSVWTERMLETLKKGVKGGTWFSLIDKVRKQGNLESAFQKVAKNKGASGVDHVTVEKFGGKLEEELQRIAETLKEGTYEPQAIRRKYIPKGSGKGMRPLGIPTVRDRVVQTALRNVIEPIYEVTFSDTSYGFRPERGCKDALRKVDYWLKTDRLYVIDIDIKSYFDTISHTKLMKRVEEQVSDGKILQLIDKFLKQGIMEEMRDNTDGRGTPQGGVISPLLANIYLNPLDHMLEEEGVKAIRYADDMVILCETIEEAQSILETVRNWMKEAQLELHPEKTRIVNMNERGAYFEFLGYHFKRTQKKGHIKRWPRKQSTRKLKETVRKYTKRTNGHSLKEIIRKINPNIRGWYEYFKHSSRGTFPPIDGWIRMRLRSILRIRKNKRGRARGYDNQRWPITYFTEHGLFSMTAAHAVAFQSA